MAAPNLFMAISRSTPSHLSPATLFRHGGQVLQMTSPQRRWETAGRTSGVKQADQAELFSAVASGTIKDAQPTHPSMPSSFPKKDYGPSIPDRIWKAPISSELNPLKYSIRRTLPYNTLPVYSVMKPGLGQIWTLIKKINGDLYKFKQDLVLDFPDSKPVLKLHLNQVLCRGKITKEVKLWLQDRGF